MKRRAVTAACGERKRTQGRLDARLGGGAVALAITIVWYKIRIHYREKIQKNVHMEHDHKVSLYAEVPRESQAASRVQGVDRQMPPIRLSMHGGSYF